MDPDSEPGTDGVILLLSFGCQVEDGYRRRGKKEAESVQERKTDTDFALGGGVGEVILSFMSSGTSDSLLPPAPAPKPVKPLCLPRVGQIVPVRVDGQRAQRVHHLPLRSLFFTCS